MQNIKSLRSPFEGRRAGPSRIATQSLDKTLKANLIMPYSRLNEAPTRRVIADCSVRTYRDATSLGVRNDANEKLFYCRNHGVTTIARSLS
ncbi:hypothetical protein OZ411_36340 [Bradyrhizobium sp. Arg237L]|uniref:hypothetical protein n=1 Tax=Bradyrhizobium sp. Arg237L TaxID=3003352 RepID=UPI00249E4D79|nr:hypothetical protein [Bradyrhizobium sp. Arg237L]MDI4238284.1 hypothetical protein [Bradyrhizobium sp. Arg237L]